MAVAVFDNTHPYLQRASPVKLAWISTLGSEKATEIAAIYTIELLLKIAKEDADPEFTWDKTDLSDLKAFEDGLKLSLKDRQESLPYDGVLEMHFTGTLSNGSGVNV